MPISIYNMKFISSSPSFSSCSSSSTTTAFDATVCNSKSATAGCLAGILRRILCYGSLPTYPSDHITEETNSYSVECFKDQDFKSNEKTETSATPGLVVRLMGLDSIPNSTPNSISRSKSMNSMDRFSGGDSMQQAHEHRRVKSTMSFREIPSTFLELENEEFFVLRFENGSKSKETRPKVRKPKMGYREVKQKRAGKSKNNENRTEREPDKKTNEVQEAKCKRVLKDLNGREMLRSRTSHKPTSKDSNSTPIPTKASNRKKTICDVLKNAAPAECTSEDLSPVSVLDCDQFLIDSQVLTSDEDSGLVSSYKGNGLTCDARKTKTIEGKYFGSRKRECHSAEYFEMWGEIYRLTEAELVGSNWTIHRGMWNYEGSAGIGADFESQILDQLLEELVDEFADFPMKIQNL